MKEKNLNFDQFVEIIQKHEFKDKDYTTSMHHSNGSGRDWEAVQKIMGMKRK